MTLWPIESKPIFKWEALHLWSMSKICIKMERRILSGKWYNKAIYKVWQYMGFGHYHGNHGSIMVISRFSLKHFFQNKGGIVLFDDWEFWNVFIVNEKKEMVKSEKWKMELIFIGICMWCLIVPHILDRYWHEQYQSIWVFDSFWKLRSIVLT